MHSRICQALLTLFLVSTIYTAPCQADELHPDVRAALPDDHPALFTKATKPNLDTGVLIVSWEGQAGGPHGIPVRYFKVAAPPKVEGLTGWNYNRDSDGRKHGLQVYVGTKSYIEVEYFHHGERLATGTYKQGKPDGGFYYYYKTEDGEQHRALRYYFGSTTGRTFESYFPNGSRHRDLTYRADEKLTANDADSHFLGRAEPAQGNYWYEDNGDRKRRIYIGSSRWTEEHYENGKVVSERSHPM